MTATSIVLVSMLALQAAPTATPQPALVLHGAEAEEFLREAELIEIAEYDNKGITRPQKATLSSDGVVLHAVFKSVDETHKKIEIGSGRMIFNLRDYYKNEIAAYELDKLLDLDFVPPTVERKIHREWGSLQAWVYGAMTEWERTKELGLKAPDIVAWNNQIATAKIFLQLVWDADFNNISNLLIDDEWKIWVIDSSRAFHTDPDLRNEESLNRFSRRILEALEELDESELKTVMKPWLSPRQIKSLWQRRCRILELADERVAEFGGAVVLYD
jgi:hypothetical protein